MSPTKRFLFVALLAVLLSSPVTASKPFWLREGVYLSYYAFDDESQGPIADYIRNGTYYSIGADGLLVNFTVLEVTGNTARVGVKLVFLPGKGVNDSVMVYTATRGEDPEPLFSWLNYSGLRKGWIHEGNVSLLSAVARTKKPLVIEGEYFIKLGNGSVYTLDGRYIGHTILWGLRDLKVNDTLFVFNGTPVRVASNRIINKTVLTYYGSFERPNGMFFSEFCSHDELWTAWKAVFFALYNPQLDLTLTFLGPVPDLIAVGVIFVDPSDGAARRFNLEHKNELTKIPLMRMQGLSLYDTNVRENRAVFPARPPRSGLRVAFLVSLIVLGVALLKGGVLNGKAA
ncbi:hypothetical protein [Thermococcus sp. AM4]|uniref:hypothetical protein n=1 Tax=Thermococcus sp. (strain AM4) TaxID=246969 RepID=UPI00022997DA|nr:hypothetical protein [Thermococcus sp. AM4]AEO13915.1 hypothetical protein TAM4_2315 [Thermococcus sp. AM4]